MASPPSGSIQGGLYSTFKSGQSIHRRAVMFGPNANDVVIHEEVTSSSDGESVSSTNGYPTAFRVPSQPTEASLPTSLSDNPNGNGNNSSDAQGVRVRHMVYPVYAPYSDLRHNPKSPILEGIRAFSSDVEIPIPETLKTKQLQVEKPYMKKRSGLRKQRRFFNDYFIMEQLNQLLPQSAEAARQEWYRMFCFQNKESVFQQLLENEDSARAFAPFINISMDEEAELLAKLEHTAAQKKSYKKKKAALRSAHNPNIRFFALPEDVREYLRRKVESDMLLMLQNVCVQYILSGATEKKLEFTFSKEERYMCRAVATYYKLSSKSHTRRSVTQEEGVRVTVVKCKGRDGMPPLPTLSLKDYLLTITA